MKKSNKAKFKELSPKEKREYIWEYYKLHIIGGIIVVYIIGSLLNTWVFNPPPKTAVSITFMGTAVSFDRAEELEAELDPIIVTEEMGNKKVFVSTYFRSGATGQPDLDMANQTKFLANISAKELDVLIVDRDKFEELVITSTALPLDEILSADELQKIGDQLIELKSEEDTEAQIYGINVTDNNRVKTVMVGENEKVMCVISNSQRLEESKQVIKWFLEME